MDRLKSLAGEIPAVLRALVNFWAALQVELQGQYSPNRLDELHEFTRQTGLVRAAAILLLTPVSCTVMAIVLDVMPLRSPTGGIHQQSITYWLRVIFTFAIVTPCIILQFQHGSSRLPLTRWPFIATITLTAAAAPIFFLAFHLLIGFPTPFTIQLVAPTVYPLLCGLMWAMWKKTIRGDAEVQRDLQQFMLLSTCLLTMLLLYPVMIFAFGKLNGIQQTLFSFAFPVLKLMFKNCASRGLFRLEDLAPVYVVTGIDVFHALLLSCAMQSASSLATLVSVMSVDVLQGVIAFVEVRAIVNRVNHLHLEARTPVPLSPLQSRVHRPTNILSVAYSFLKSNPHIRNDPVVELPRHQRQVQWQGFSSWSVHMSPKRVVRVACTGPSINVNSVRPPLVKEDSDVMDRRAAEVEYVRFTLKLLHMVEFYVLIEFIEVVVAVIYAIYLAAMFYLPNRAYFPAVRALTQDQLTEAVGQVLHYAAFELFSLVVLCVVFDRLLGFSTLRLLAFTLRKHAVLVQSQLTMWVFASTQLSLEHFGCDYTFRFAWLRYQAEQNRQSGGSSSA